MFAFSCFDINLLKKGVDYGGINQGTNLLWKQATIYSNLN